MSEASGAGRSFDPRRLEAHFGTAVVSLCGLYFVLEALYVLRLPLVMDEFQVASHIHRLLEGLPYRDFEPYKNMLGYYLLLPAIAVGGPWLPLMLAKLEIALLCALGLGLSAHRLARHFRPAAVLLGLALLVVMSTWLERSAELRVDALSGLAGLACLCLLLERRDAAAGAAAAALLAEPTRRRLREPLAFAAGAALPLALYYGLSLLLSASGDVLGASLGRAASVALESHYSIHHFWAQTILRNPYFYAVAGLALGALYSIRRDPERGETAWRLIAFGGVLLGLALWHKQPWPYFFVLILPALYVLAVAFFDLELGRQGGDGRSFGAAALALYLVAGLAYPASRIGTALGRSNEHQRLTVERAAALLEPGDRYFAGWAVLRGHSQAGPSWLDARHRAELRAMDPAQARASLDEIEDASPRLMVDSYRLHDTPEWLRSYLERRFAPYWGPIHLYAPALPAGRGRVEIRFTGTYRLDATEDARFVVDGRPRAPGERIALEKGFHELEGSAPFRLRLEPPEALRFEGPDEALPLFPEVYTY